MLFRPSTRTTLKHKALLLQKEPKPLIWSYDPETPKPFSSSNPQLQEAKPCNPKRLGPFVVRASQNPYNYKTLNPQPEHPPASQRCVRAASAGCSGDQGLVGGTATLKGVLIQGPLRISS